MISLLLASIALAQPLVQLPPSEPWERWSEPLELAGLATGDQGPAVVVEVQGEEWVLVAVDASRSARVKAPTNAEDREGVAFLAASLLSPPVRLQAPPLPPPPVEEIAAITIPEPVVEPVIEVESELHLRLVLGAATTLSPSLAPPDAPAPFSPWAATGGPWAWAWWALPPQPSSRPRSPSGRSPPGRGLAPPGPPPGGRPGRRRLAHLPPRGAHHRDRRALCRPRAERSLGAGSRRDRAPSGPAVGPPPLRAPPRGRGLAGPLSLGGGRGRGSVGGPARVVSARPCVSLPL